MAEQQADSATVLDNGAISNKNKFMKDENTELEDEESERVILEEKGDELGKDEKEPMEDDYELDKAISQENENESDDKSKGAMLEENYNEFMDDENEPHTSLAETILKENENEIEGKKYPMYKEIESEAISNKYEPLWEDTKNKYVQDGGIKAAISEEVYLEERNKLKPIQQPDLDESDSMPKKDDYKPEVVMEENAVPAGITNIYEDEIDENNELRRLMTEDESTGN